MLKALCTHVPAFSLTSSSWTQLVPLSLEMYTGIVSLFGSDPVLFEYQRQYLISGCWPAVASKVDDVNVVDPPSTSASPRAPPGTPWPVTQHIVPEGV